MNGGIIHSPDCGLLRKLPVNKMGGAMDSVLNNTRFYGDDLLLDASSIAPDLLTLVMDELACGLMVVTMRGHILHANQAARLGLERSGMLTREGTELCVDSSGNFRLIHEAIARVSQGQRSLVELSVGAEVLPVAVVPLRGESGQPTRAALVFARGAVHESLMLGFFARGHNLTATEEHVLGILCQGYSTPEIAVRMKVAVSTVRSHVRSLCAKTRSRGVRELVNLVAVLPPVAPVARQLQVH